MPVLGSGLVGLFIFTASSVGWGTGRLDVFYQGIVMPRTGVILIDSAIEGKLGIFATPSAT